VALVLSTTWVRTFGLASTTERLPEHLLSGVAGSTWGSGIPEFELRPRHNQILQTAKRFRLQQWLAVDDDAKDCPAEHRDCLVQTFNEAALSGRCAREALYA